MSLADLIPGLALFWLSAFPFSYAAPESWVGPLLLLAAAARPHARLRLGLAMPALFALLGLWEFSFHGISALASLPAYAALCLALAAGRSSSGEGARRGLALSLVMALGYEFSLALMQRSMVLPGREAFSLEAQKRCWGSFVTANIFSGWLVMALPLLGGLALSEKNRAMRILNIGGLALGAVLLAWTRSAGAVLAAALAAGAALLLFSRGLGAGLRKALAWALAGSFALLALVIFERGFTWMQPDSGKDLVFGRLLLWIPGVSAILEHPWAGYGNALAEEAYRQAQVQTATGFGRYPHQLFLSLGISYGIPGILAAMSGLYLYRNRLVRLLEKGEPWRWGAALSCLAAFFHGQWEMSLQQPSLALTAFVLAGLSLVKEVEEPGPEAPFMPSRGGLWAPSLLLALVLAWRGGLMTWQWVLASGCLLLLWAPFKPLRWPNTEDIPLWASLLFAASLLPSVVNSIEPGPSAAQWALVLGLFFWWNSLRSEKAPALNWIRAAWTATALVFSVAVVLRGLYLGSTRPDLLGRIWGMVIPIHAVHDYFPNQNLLAGALIVPAALFCLASLQDGGKPAIKIALLAWFFLFLSYCGSRGAAMALAAGMGWMLLRSMKTGFKRALLVLGGGAAAFGLASFVIPQATFSQRINAQNSAEKADPYSGFRAKIWKESLALALQRPAAGWGLGEFEAAFQTRALPTPAREPYTLQRYRLRVEHAHQEWLELAAESGFPAALFALALLLAVFWRFWRQPCQGPCDAALEAVVAAFAAQSLVDFNLHCPAIAALLLIVLALKFPAEPQPLPQALRFGGLLMASLVLSIAAQQHLSRGMKRPPDDVQAALNPFSADIPMNIAGRTAVLGAPAQFGKAVRLATQSLRMAPDSSRNQYRAAVIFHDAARRCPPEQLELLGQLVEGWEKTRLEFPASTSAERFEFLSRKSMARAIELRPFDARLRMAAATLEQDSGHEAEAARHRQAALELEPNLAAAWQRKALDAEIAMDRKALREALLKLQEIERIPIEADDEVAQQIKSANWDWVHEKLKSLNVKAK